MYSCDKCGRYSLYDQTCRCQKFIIDHDGEPYEKYAQDAEDAALKWAEGWNENGDYTLMNSTEYIEITDSQGAKLAFTVGAEPDIHYTVSGKPLHTESK